MNPAPSYLNQPLLIDAGVLHAALGEGAWPDAGFDGFSDIHGANGERLLSFLSNIDFAEQLNANPRIAGVFCRADATALLRDDIEPVVVDDPKFHFFTLVDHVARTHAVGAPTRIAASAAIAPGATIAPHSVVIGERVVIEPGVYVAPGTLLGNDVTVRANATLGVDGFQHQRTSRGIVSPLHCGLLIVGDGAEIGYGASVSRGFSYRHTVIGAHVKMDALVYVAHGTSIGANTIVCAHACVMGHVDVGENAWLGPNCTVTSRVRVGAGGVVSLGAVVTRDVQAGERVSGNFAFAHERFIADLRQRASGT